jgi:hypothetical protein
MEAPPAIKSKRSPQFKSVRRSRFFRLVILVRQPEAKPGALRAIMVVAAAATEESAAAVAPAPARPFFFGPAFRYHRVNYRTKYPD